MNINTKADKVTTQKIYGMIEDFKKFSNGGTTAYLKAATEISSINEQIISMYERDAVNLETLKECENRVKNILNNLRVPITEKN